MSVTMLLLVSACGGAGAVARFVLDTLIKRAWPSVFPRSTLTINVLASFFFAAALVFLRNLPIFAVYTLVTTGFLGGFSTFSTAMNEVVTLARGAHWRECCTYAVLSVGLPVLTMLLSIMLFVSVRG
ncbi:fluoride efflux transporter FluC [Alloscardovia macacae]|nr:CrcB family protein [Alloscardovia macacae]